MQWRPFQIGSICRRAFGARDERDRGAVQADIGFVGRGVVAEKHLMIGAGQHAGAADGGFAIVVGLEWCLRAAIRHDATERIVTRDAADDDVATAHLR